MAETSGYTNKQEILKINNDLNLIKNEGMNTLTDNIPYIENCMMMTYVRNGKLFVEIIDGRTVDVMRREEEKKEENKEPKEQEEVINEFLCNINEMEEEEPEEQEDFKTQDDRLLLTTANHIFRLEQIETKNYVPIKQAILKFIEQAQDGRNYLDEPYVYTPKFTWHKKLQKYHWLEIHKQGTRYVCSKERLEHIDFKVVEAPSRLYRCWHC